MISPNPHQRVFSITSPTTPQVAKASSQTTSTPPRGQQTPQSPKASDSSRPLRSRTSSFSDDRSSSVIAQNTNSPLPTRTNSNSLRSRSSSKCDDNTSNDDPPTNSWFKYAWQKLKKAPRGSQMFHSPPLIRALQTSKSETTTKISHETWNKLHIAHMYWDDYVTNGTYFYRPLMNKVIQKAFTAEIRLIGLQGDNDKINLKRISATQAIAIKKAWTCIEDDQLKGTVFTWEAPLEAHSLWTSPKKGSLITCIKTPPNPALGALLDQTGTLIPGKNETIIQIKFTSGKITWQREHADYITAREPNCLLRITDIHPDTNNNIMAIVNPVKRNNSKTNTRIIPIKVAKTLITRHINQEMIHTHDRLEDFPNTSEQMQIPTKSLHRYFTHETCPFSVQRRTQNPDESRTFLNVGRHHNFSLNRGHIILAIQR
jgi:hypothetical protein